MERLGLELVANDEQFQKALANYVTGLSQAGKITDTTGKAITVAWNDAAQRFQNTTTGKFLGSANLLTQGMEQYRKQFAEFQAQQANARVFDNLESGVNKTTSAIGMSRREWMRTGSEAAFYARTAMSALGTVDKGLTETIGLGTQLVESFAFGGGVGVGVGLISTGVGYLASEMQKARIEAEKVIEPFKKIRDEISALTELKGISKMAADLGVSEEALKKYITSSQEGARASLEFSDAQTSVKIAEQQLAAARKELADLGISEAQAQMTVGQAYQGTEAVGAALFKRQQDLITTINNLNNALPIMRANLDQLTPSTAAAAMAAAEFNAQLDFYKANFPNAAKEIESFNQQLASLTKTHLKTMAGFDKDWIKAIEKASKAAADAEKDAREKTREANEDKSKREKEIYDNAAKDIAEREQEKLERIADLNRDHGEKEQDDYRSYARAISDLNDEMTQRQKDNAKELEALNADELDKEQQAHTWAQVQQIRKEAARRYKDTVDKQKETETEADKKRKRVDDDYYYNKAKGDRELAEAIAREQEQTRKSVNEIRQRRDEQINSARQQRDEQIADAWNTAEEQKAAARERLADEQAAIIERRDAENAAYTEQKAAATIAHQQRMNELLIYKTEAERMDAYWKTIAGAGYIVPIRYYYELTGTSPFTSPGSRKRSEGEGFQTSPGQYKIVPGSRNEPRIGILHGGEIVYRPKSSNAIDMSGRRGLTLNINAPVYGVNDLQNTIWRALDRYDRR